MQVVTNNEQWVKEEIKELLVNNSEYLKDYGAAWSREFPFLYSALFFDHFNFRILKELYFFAEWTRTKKFGDVTRKKIVFSTTIEDLISELEMKYGYKFIEDLKIERIKLTLVHLDKIGFISLHSPYYFSKDQNETTTTFYFSFGYLCGYVLECYNQELRIEANKYFNTYSNKNK